MVQDAVNQNIGGAAEYVDVEPVEEFLNVLGLVLGQAIRIVEQKVVEGGEVLGHSAHLLVEPPIGKCM